MAATVASAVANSLNKSSGLAGGDYQCIAVNCQDTGVATITNSSGFTFVGVGSTPSNGQTTQAGLFYKYITDGTAAAAEPTTYTVGGQTVYSSVTFRVSGADPTTFADVAAVKLSATASATRSVGPITPANDNDLILAVLATWANETQGSAGSVFTSVAKDVHTGGDDCEVMRYALGAGTAGAAQGPWTYTTSATDLYRMLTVAVRAAPSGATVPSAPAAPSVVADHKALFASLAAAPADGGASITDYVWEYAPGPGYSSWTTVADGTSAGLAVMITGLTAGTSYKVRATATNSVGNSSAGTASSAAVPVDLTGNLALENGTSVLVTEAGLNLGTEAVASATVPGAPTSVAGTAGNGQVALTWTAPASNGGSAITDYVVQYAVSPFSSWTSFTHTASTTAAITVTGLTNGTGYQFRVAAVNAVGTGSSSSASSTVTPAATVPGAPTSLAGTPTSGQVALTWTAPASNGGSAITDYTVEYSVSPFSSWTAFSHTASTTAARTVTGLTNGTAYKFRVSAVNAVGTGSPITLAGTYTPASGGTSLTWNFNKADGPDPDWTSVGGGRTDLTVVSNKLSTVNTGQHDGYLVTATLNPSHDYQISFDYNVTDVTGDGGAQVGVFDTSNNGYSVFIGNAAHIFPWVAGAQQGYVTNTGRTGNAGSCVFARRASDSHMEVWDKGVQVATSNDNSTPSASGLMVVYVNMRSATHPTPTCTIDNLVISDTITVF